MHFTYLTYLSYNNAYNWPFRIDFSEWPKIDFETSLWLGDERILYNNQIYHQQCFVCSECKTPGIEFELLKFPKKNSQKLGQVDKNRFFKSEGKLKCYNCFSKRRNSLSGRDQAEKNRPELQFWSLKAGSVCPVCNEIIKEGAVAFS